MKKSNLIGVKILSGKWNFGETTGTVIKETRDGYVVVDWENVNGEWHYTAEQFKRFEKVAASTGEQREKATLLD